MKQPEKQLIITDTQVAGYLKEKEGKLKLYGGRDFNLPEFLRGAMIVIMDSPKLKKALTTEKGRSKLFQALKHGASMGLSLNPQKKEACLIPYETKDGIQIDYQIMKEGYIQLALNSGKVEYITADIVYENDKFEIQKSMDGDSYVFSPNTKDRGKIIGAFAAMKTISGIGHLKWMTKTEINQIRDTYSIMYQKNKENSPWHNSYPGMALKTVLKALFRTISISPDMKKAIETDDYFEYEPEPRNVTPGSNPEQVKESIKKKDKPKDKEKPEPEPEQVKTVDLF